MIWMLCWQFKRLKSGRKKLLSLNLDKTQALFVRASSFQSQGMHQALDGVPLPLPGAVLGPTLLLEASVASVTQGPFYQLCQPVPSCLLWPHSTHSHPISPPLNIAWTGFSHVGFKWQHAYKQLGTENALHFQQRTRRLLFTWHHPANMHGCCFTKCKIITPSKKVSAPKGLAIWKSTQRRWLRKCRQNKWDVVISVTVIRIKMAVQNHLRNSLTLY